MFDNCRNGGIEQRSWAKTDPRRAIKKVAMKSLGEICYNIQSC